MNNNLLLIKREYPKENTQKRVYPGLSFLSGWLLLAPWCHVKVGFLIPFAIVSAIFAHALSSFFDHHHTFIVLVMLIGIYISQTNEGCHQLKPGALGWPCLFQCQCILTVLILIINPWQIFIQIMSNGRAWQLVPINITKWVIKFTGIFDSMPHSCSAVANNATESVFTLCMDNNKNINLFNSSCHYNAVFSRSS